MTEQEILSDGRLRHIVAKSLAIGLAVMEATAREFRALSDMEDMEALLARIATSDLERDLYNQQAWKALAAIGKETSGEAR